MIYSRKHTKSFWKIDVDIFKEHSRKAQGGLFVQIARRHSYEDHIQFEFGGYSTLISS
jgi:hypothetical protein